MSVAEPESAAPCSAGIAPAPTGGIPEAAAFAHDRMEFEDLMTDQQRVGVVYDLEVEMWACRVARVPDAADDLDDPNILSLVGRDRFGRQIGDGSQTPVRSQEAVNR